MVKNYVLRQNLEEEEMKKRGERKNRRCSMRAKLIGILISVIIIPLFLLGGLSYFKSFDILEKKLSTTSIQAIGVVETVLNSYFEGLEIQVKILSDNPVFEKISPTSNLYDGSGVNKEVAVNLLKSHQKNNEDVVHSYFASSNKEMYIYPNIDLPDGFDPTNRPWYQKAVEKNGEIAWTEPYVDAQTGEMTITVTKAIIKEGQVLGVIAADVDLAYLSSQISSMKIGRKGYVALTTMNGILLAHPEKNYIGSDMITKLDIWKDVQGKEEGFLKFTQKGKNNFAAFTTEEALGLKILGIMELDELVADTNIIKTFILYSTLIAILVAILVSYFISKSITNPLNILKETFGKAAEGDLTVNAQINSKDEFEDLGKSFNTMIQSINDLIKEVKTSSHIVLDSSSSLANITDQTSIATNEVASAIEDIARTSNDQAKDTQEGAVKVEELAEKIEAVLSSAQHINHVSRKINQLNEKGLETVNVLSKKSKESADSAQAVSKMVLEVDQQSEKIGAITQAITQIAEQTNLLALNAAIEAARAGEQGRGFAVVAEEVRKLAEESGNAAKEIKELIDGIQYKSKYAVNEMNETKSIVQEQNKSVMDTYNVFDDISKSIEEFMKNIEKIEDLNKDMENKKDEIIQVIGNLSASSQETSAATQEVSASTEEQLASIQQVASFAQDLKTLADGLERSIDQFKVK